MKKQSVLVGSPVYQKPEILEKFLTSLKNLRSQSITIDFIFMDDNSNPISSQLLSAFERKGSFILCLPGKEEGKYVCNEESHLWSQLLMRKVADYKNAIIKHAIKNKYDFLFLIDSDLVIHPGLIEYLITLKKDIVSEIFWSQWHKNMPLEPNVWLYDEYDLVPKSPGEELSEKEKKIRRTKFLNRLREPGVYQVGGLGACTLLNKNALQSNVSFEPIHNLTIWGEDRFFCIRAAVLGLALFVDTHYPAYHIYRERDLEGVKEYVDKNNMDIAFERKYKEKGNRITLSMIVKNEENRYLKKVLESLKDHIDEAVILDDASSDNTVLLCREILKGIPLHMIRNTTSLFQNEYKLRQQQWQETIQTNPDWILNLDADEVLEESFWILRETYLNDSRYDVYCFRLYDMWDDFSYREDTYWNAHNIYRPFLMRYQPKFQYEWKESSLHCGRFPNNIFSFPKASLNTRIQHLGWSCVKEREKKFKRYQEADPDGIFGVKEQYNSILDSCVNLVKWEETQG